MRIVIFLSATLIAALLTLAQPGSVPQSMSKSEILPQNQVISPRSGDGIKMWRRAFIRVTPMELVTERRAALDSLRTRVARSQIESMKLRTRDPLVREQLARQDAVIDALLKFAELQDTDQGKSPAAIEVQQHLNQIEGHVMCDACHTGIPLKSTKVVKTGITGRVFAVGELLRPVVGACNLVGDYSWSGLEAGYVSEQFTAQ